MMNVLLAQCLKFSNNMRALTTKTPNGYALLIGVGKFDQNVFPYLKTIRSVKNTVKLIKNSLMECKFNIFSMLNKYANKFNFYSTLRHLSTLISDGDIFVLYFFGHGYLLPDKSYPKEKTGYDQSWVFFDFIFSDDNLNLWLNTLKKNIRIIIISDSCYSAGMFPEKGIKIKNASILFLAATGSNKYANAYKYGLFTKELVTLFRTGKYSSYEDLMHQVSTNVENQVHTQKPQFALGGQHTQLEKTPPFKI